MKTCSKCKVPRGFDDYYKSSRSKDGYKARCKICCDEDQAKRQKPPVYKNKLSPDGEKAANAAALQKLVKAHPSEFFALLAKERLTRREPVNGSR